MYVNDAGTLRRVRSAYANDAGTLRRVRQFYLNDAGVLRRQGFTLLGATLTEGDSPEGADPVFWNVYGYATTEEATTLPIGSLSPDTFGANTVTDFYTLTLAGVAVLKISGFSSDPGAAFLTEVTFNGVTELASGASYSYSAGSARWKWSFHSFVFDGTGSHDFVLT